MGALTAGSGAPLPVAVGIVGICAAVVAAILAFVLRRQQPAPVAAA